MGRRGELRRGLPALGVAIPIVILFVTILSIPLTAAQKLGLSDAQISSWIVTLYGVATALGLVLAIRYRQPLILTGNVFAIIFIASVHGQVSYRELIGASILAGAVVAILGAIGLSGHLAAWIPSPIVMGLLAGAVLPYVAGVFTALDQERLVVGSTIAAYILGRRFLTSRFPAIFPALLVGIAVTIVSGRLGQTSIHWTLPTIVVTAPTFTLRGFATATPVLVLLMTLQANVPSVVYLRSQGYTPPERTVDVVSGLGTVAGSLLGPTAISIPVLLTPLVAGPDAGEHAIRHWSAYLAGGAGVG
ncbi:MAG TPA: benzoate/H(+) symporter BenE family transporter, partial [Actinomycetota bacterium]